MVMICNRIIDHSSFLLLLASLPLFELLFCLLFLGGLLFRLGGLLLHIGGLLLPFIFLAIIILGRCDLFSGIRFIVIIFRKS